MEIKRKDSMDPCSSMGMKANTLRSPFSSKTGPEGPTGPVPGAPIPAGVSKLSLDGATPNDRRISSSLSCDEDEGAS